jgi:hypothetical protein
MTTSMTNLVTRFLGQDARGTTARRPRNVISLETLEGRISPSSFGSFGLDSGVGTNQNVTITITGDGDKGTTTTPTTTTPPILISSPPVTQTPTLKVVYA